MQHYQKVNGETLHTLKADTEDLRAQLFGVSRGLVESINKPEKCLHTLQIVEALEKKHQWRIAKEEAEGCVDREGYISEYWEALAKADFRHTIVANFEGTEEDFYQSGESLILGLNGQFQLFNESTRVLDLGCGAGRIAKALQGRVKSLLGVDVSETMLTRAKSQIDDSAFEFKKSDGHGLSFVSDNSIDFAYSILVLQHMPETVMQSHFVDVARTLVPGGKFLFQIPYPGAYPEVLRAEGQLWEAASYSKEEIEHLLSKFSLSIQSYWTYSNERNEPVDQFFIATKV